jgi:Domain of unknown function (DUF6438)
MNPSEPDPAPPMLAPATFVVLGATLALMAMVPAALWFAETGLLPWSRELHWLEQRQRIEPPASRFEAGDFVSLQREGCFGACPVYEIRVFETGRVQFTGIAFVCAKGVHETQIDAALSRDLLGDLLGGGLLELTWEPGALIADAPSAYITWSRGQASHRIERHHGDPRAPRLLVSMERAIDEVAGSDRWLPKRIGGDLICEFPDGSRKRLYDLEFPKT